MKLLGRCALNARFLIVALALLTAWIAAPRDASAGEPIPVAVAPATANLQPGSTTQIDITAASVPGVPGLGGYFVQASWDPAVLEVTAFIDAGWITSGNIIPLCPPPVLDNTAGKAFAACTPIFGSGVGVSSEPPRALVTAIFRAKGAGVTAIDLTGSFLQGPPGSQNPVITLTNGSVTVADPAPATAAPSTSTAIPSATAVSTGTPLPNSPSPSTNQVNTSVISTKTGVTAFSTLEIPSTGTGTAGETEKDGGGWFIAAVGVLALGAAASGATYLWYRRRLGAQQG